MFTKPSIKSYHFTSKNPSLSTLGALFKKVDREAVDSTYKMLEAKINWLQTLDKYCMSVMNTDIE